MSAPDLSYMDPPVINLGGEDLTMKFYEAIMVSKGLPLNSNLLPFPIVIFLDKVLIEGKIYFDDLQHFPTLVPCENSAGSPRHF